MCTLRRLMPGFIWRYGMHLPITRLVLMAGVCFLSGCEREPSDPLEAYLWQFESKTQALFDHLANADELIQIDAAALGDAGMLEEEVEVYRYMQVAPAAGEVITHLATPPRSLILALDGKPADPVWVERLAQSITNARATLHEHIKAFKTDMPADPTSPDQDGPVGSMLIGACQSGGVFSGSQPCKVHRYAYDDEGQLFFFVWRNRQLQKLMIEQILDIDMQDWVRTLQATSKYETVWFCNNLWENADTGEQQKWSSRLYIQRDSDDELSWLMRNEHRGQSPQARRGQARFDHNQLVLQEEGGYENKLQYTNDVLAEGQLVRLTTRERIRSMASCCPQRYCSDAETLDSWK